MPLEQLELRKFQEKIDRQIADAQDRRRYDRLGGQSFKNIYLNDISRYDLPNVISRDKLGGNSPSGLIEAKGSMSKPPQR